jgi:hypothetical protein
MTRFILYGTFKNCLLQPYRTFKFVCLDHIAWTPKGIPEASARKFAYSSNNFLSCNLKHSGGGTKISEATHLGGGKFPEAKLCNIIGKCAYLISFYSFEASRNPPKSHYSVHNIIWLIAGEFNSSPLQHHRGFEWKQILVILFCTFAMWELHNDFQNESSSCTATLVSPLTTNMFPSDSHLEVSVFLSLRVICLESWWII